MFKCPFCTNVPWESDEKQQFRLHVKNIHGSTVQSGSCPYKGCMKTFGDVYKYIKHVEISHEVTKKTDCQKRKADEASDKSQTNRIVCLELDNAHIVPVTNEDTPQIRSINQRDELSD